MRHISEHILPAALRRRASHPWCDIFWSALVGLARQWKTLLKGAVVMNTDETRAREETLDPVDWRTMRELGHRMVDDLMTYLEEVRDRPVWQPIPQEVKARLQQPAVRDRSCR